MCQFTSKFEIVEFTGNFRGAFNVCDDPRYSLSEGETKRGDSGRPGRPVRFSLEGEIPILPVASCPTCAPIRAPGGYFRGNGRPGSSRRSVRAWGQLELADIHFNGKNGDPCAPGGNPSPYYRNGAGGELGDRCEIVQLTAKFGGYRLSCAWAPFSRNGGRRRAGGDLLTDRQQKRAY